MSDRESAEALALKIALSYYGANEAIFDQRASLYDNIIAILAPALAERDTRIGRLEMRLEQAAYARIQTETAIVERDALLMVILPYYTDDALPRTTERALATLAEMARTRDNLKAVLAEREAEIAQLKLEDQDIRCVMVERDTLRAKHAESRAELERLRKVEALAKSDDGAMGTHYQSCQKHACCPGNAAHGIETEPLAGPNLATAPPEEP